MPNNGNKDNAQENNGATKSIRIAVLGARGVGKTSLVEQFVLNEFTSHYKSTRHKRLYFVTAYINDHFYQMQIIDLPTINSFPLNSLSEWNAFPGYSLRHIDAIVLVFDITNVDSFKHVEGLRQQIMKSYVTPNVRLIVVANKCDVIDETQQHISRRDVATIVKKQWRCPYIEISAKHNWRVTSAFRELMQIIDTGELPHKTTSSRVQSALRRNSCVIL